MLWYEINEKKMYVWLRIFGDTGIFPKQTTNQTPKIDLHQKIQTLGHIFFLIFNEFEIIWFFFMLLTKNLAKNVWFDYLSTPIRHHKIRNVFGKRWLTHYL